MESVPDFLREFRASDAEVLVELLNNPNVSRYPSSRVPYPYTANDASWWIEEGSRQGFIRAITDGGQLAGCVGVEFGLIVFGVYGKEPVVA